MVKIFKSYINRLFPDEEAGKAWAQRKALNPDMSGYKLEMGWRKIKYAPEEPEMFSVSFTKNKEL